jgi:hypothetical protein
MKTELIKSKCKEIFDGRITGDMVSSIEEMFNEFMKGKSWESKGLENDLDRFFDEMSLDIECELESWD